MDESSTIAISSKKISCTSVFYEKCNCNNVFLILLLTSRRLVGLMDKSKVVIGGETDANERYIAPTVLFNVSPDDKVMQEEIFGPLLPFLTVKDHNEAIDFINGREKPLSLYVYTANHKVYEDFANYTSSGSMGLNECILQIGCKFQ